MKSELSFLSTTTSSQLTMSQHFFLMICIFPIKECGHFKAIKIYLHRKLRLQEVIFIMELNSAADKTQYRQREE